MSKYLELIKKGTIYTMKRLVRVQNNIQEEPRFTFANVCYDDDPCDPVGADFAQDTTYSYEKDQGTLDTPHI